MEDAFSSEDEDEHAASHGELTPLTIGQQDASTNPGHVFTTTRGNGIYDFERDCDCPPPGSPPCPSSTALPNSFGTSNGNIPTSPIASAFPRPSFFRRTFGSLLPSYYQRVPVNEVRARLRGGGSENDGVFANVAAKPGSGRTVSVRAANGDIYMVPEEAQSEAPPVCPFRPHFVSLLTIFCPWCSHMHLPRQIRRPLTGRQPSTYLQ